MKNDGGPAFSRSATDVSFGQKGMSLRDYFAGQALIGYLSSPGDSVVSYTECASIAYMQADAMLKAREVG